MTNRAVSRLRAVSGRPWFVVLVESLVIAIATIDTAPWTGESAVSLILGFVSAAGLALRRKLPVVSWLLCLPAVVSSVALVAPLVAVYSVARFTSWQWLLRGVVVVTFAANVFSAVHGDGTTGLSTVAFLQMVVYCALLSVGPAALGAAYSARNELRHKLVELVSSQERERRLIAASAIAEERTRLAREMHDVVSHQVSLIALQAGALRVTSSNPQTEEAARTIRRLATDTLNELRVMVGVLRYGQDTELTPQPRLADIARLIDTSGLSTRLHDELTPGLTWSDPVQRAAYRSVQEGLTNVRKHAPGAQVDVYLCNDSLGLTVRVANDAPPVAPLAHHVEDDYPSGRQGLIGLRERAELLGGEVHAGPRPDGGYDLVVRLNERPVPVACTEPERQLVEVDIPTAD